MEAGKTYHCSPLLNFAVKFTVCIHLLPNPINMSLIRIFLNFPSAYSSLLVLPSQCLLRSSINSSFCSKKGIQCLIYVFCCSLLFSDQCYKLTHFACTQLLIAFK